MRKIYRITAILLSSLFTFLLTCMPPSIIFAQQDLKSSIDSYVKTFLEEQKIPGASIALVHENEIFYVNEWGVTGETKTAVTTQTPFIIGSISKSFTGLAIMKLIEENLINLEDPIKNYMPWFTLKDRQPSSKITIKQLLTHTSGISTYTGLSIADKGTIHVGALKNEVKKFSKIGLSSQPGEKYQYSSANYLLLGALIEEVTNRPFSEYMEEHIFLPLKMKNASANEYSAIEKGYEGGFQSWFGYPFESTVAYDNMGASYGYMTASADDLIHYIQFISKQTTQDLLTDTSLDSYLSPLHNTRKDQSYGFGLRISDQGTDNEMIWHSGSTPDFHAEVFYMPETTWGGVILTNKNHILEEGSLPALKKGIISLVNGESPEPIPQYIPIIPFILLGMGLACIILSISVILKLKTGKLQYRLFWYISGITLILLSISAIPLFSFVAGVPWQSITVFAPDIAFLTKVLVLLIALNGLLFISVPVKQKIKFISIERRVKIEKAV
ncbi:serine hydrolase domain-containing protein [Bacillus spongiae]|uniref:Serine hydrolase domain-containing protein n=1 Tax=Bacillus spongiae TaxID=2683610 RepID=A0ABU8HFU9_9BACI